ncbi:MAG TPA: cytochrome c oxidase assembly factor 1 family protein [Chthoniobacterales bacterium]|nr:cytochrome c oxidase assembly factor 1 family protein [Chthoniobacterales bacterium]
MLDLLDVDPHKEAMESTPPPLPQTPPPATPPPPPRKGWWSRNWKWFVPTGCFTLIALGVLLVVCMVLFVFGVLKSSDVYKTAVARAKDDQRVTAALGTPIREGMVPSGSTKVNGPSGEANIAIPISGPKGKGTIYAEATKASGEWTFSKLEVKIDNGDTIDLNESAKSKPASDSASVSNEADADEEETSDERVEAITLAREEGGKLRAVKNFKRADSPQHVVVILTDGNEGTHVRTVWTNLNAAGATNQKLWEKELVTTEENRRADFSLSNSGSKTFPPGDYKIDIYLDDELIQTVPYKVQ